MSPVRVAFMRLVRTRRAAFLVLFWAVLPVASALALRGSGAYGPLSNVVGAWSLPFVAFTLAGALGERGDLTRSVKQLVALGVPATRASGAHVVVAIVLSASIMATSAAATAVAAHGASDPPMAADALTAAWIATVGGAAYAGAFCLGSTFGKGAGRSVVLAGDWLLAGTGTLAALVPRSHVHALFGGPPVLGLRGLVSALCLVALASITAGLTIVRTRRLAR